MPNPRSHAPVYRVDGITYVVTGWSECVVIAIGSGAEVHRTRLYKRADEDGTPPAMRAIKAAQQWIGTRAPVRDGDG